MTFHLLKSLLYLCLYRVNTRALTFQKFWFLNVSIQLAPVKMCQFNFLVSI